MFNEELDLGEPVEEKEGGEKRDGASGTRKTDSHTYVIGQVKQEVQDGVKTEAREGPSATQHPAPQHGVVTISGPPGPPGAEATGQPGSSTLLIKVGPSLTFYYSVITNK